MADSKLRLAIVTTLDNSGIKATKEQIDQLEQSIGKLNSSSRGGGGGGGEGGGVFGSMDKQATGLAKRAVGLVAILRAVGSLTNEIMKKATVDGKGWGEAFTQGAKSFMENTAFSLGKYFGLDFESMLSEATQAMKKRIDDLNQHLANHYAKWQQGENELLQSKLKTHRETIKAIDDETQQYKKQLTLVNQIRGNTDTAEQVFYEHQKQEALENLKIRGGNDEQIEQLSRAWDMRINQEMEKSKVRGVQEQRAQFELGVENTEKKIAANNKALREQSKLQIEYQQRIDTVKNIPAKQRSDLDRKMLEDSQKRLKDSRQLQKDIARENRALRNSLDPNLLEYQRSDFDMREAIAKSQASLSTRKMYFDYGNYMEKMESTPLDLLPKDYGSKMADTVSENYWALADIVKNTDGLPSLSEKIDQLLQLK